MARPWLGVGLALALWGGAATQAVHACAIDGIPSLRADGVAAVLNRTQPASASLTHWAPFVFRRTFRTGQIVHLSEDLRELAATLPPQMVQGRWLWRAGDGWHAEGRTAAHRFSRPGTYLVTVAVELPSHRGAFVFDAALLHVGGKPA